MFREGKPCLEGKLAAYHPVSWVAGSFFIHGHVGPCGQPHCVETEYDFSLFQLRKSSRHQGIVQHLEESFAVASLVETGQLVAFSLISHLNDTFHFDSEKLCVGQGVCLTLKTTEPGVTGLILAVEGPASKRTMTPARRDSETVDDKGEEEEGEEGDLTVRPKKRHSLAIGDKVTGTIKSVKATHAVVTLDDGFVGCIHASRILDDVPVGTSPTTTLKVGKKVTARVIGGRDVKTSKYEAWGDGAGFEGTVAITGRMGT